VLERRPGVLAHRSPEHLRRASRASRLRPASGLRIDRGDRDRPQPQRQAGPGLGLVTGLPLPSITADTGQRDTTLTAVVEATQDPTVGLSILTGSGTESPIADYLAEYLAEVSELFGVHPAELEQAWRAEFSEYLDDPLPIGAEADPSWVTVDEGEPAASTIQLSTEDRPGSAMLAIVASGEHGEIVAVSDLIGITMTEDGLVFRDF
jgi:hypothetical protein